MDQAPKGAAPGGHWAPTNPSAPPNCTLQNLTTKDFLQFLSFNGPLCKLLIQSSLKSDLNALITIYRCTLSETRAVRVLLLLFMSPSQRALSCSIHHRAAPAGRSICPTSRKVLCLYQEVWDECRNAGACAQGSPGHGKHPTRGTSRSGTRLSNPRVGVPAPSPSSASPHPCAAAAAQSGWVMPLERKKEDRGVG